MTSLQGLSMKVQRWQIHVLKWISTACIFPTLILHPLHPFLPAHKSTPLINFSPFHSSIFQTGSLHWLFLDLLAACFYITLLYLTRRPVTYSYIGGCTYALSHPALRHPAYGIFQQHLMNSLDCGRGYNHKAWTWTWVEAPKMSPFTRRQSLRASMHICVQLWSHNP